MKGNGKVIVSVGCLDWLPKSKEHYSLLHQSPTKNPCRWRGSNSMLKNNDTGIVTICVGLSSETGKLQCLAQVGEATLGQNSSSHKVTWPVTLAVSGPSPNLLGFCKKFPDFQFQCQSCTQKQCPLHYKEPRQGHYMQVLISDSSLSRKKMYLCDLID